MQSPPTTREIEAAITQGVREKLADGWTLVDVRGDYEEVTLTVAKGTQVEAHVAHVDGNTGAYRIDAGLAMPKDPIAPYPFLVRALRGGGGIEIGGDCGRVEARPYMLERSAKGAAAARLVASTLKTSRDVEYASVEAEHATLGLTMKDNRTVELHVALDNEIVVAAEVRQYEFIRDTTKYSKHRQLRRTLGTSVTSIEAEGYNVILGGDTRFTIDMEDLVDEFPDGHEGCGC